MKHYSISNYSIITLILIAFSHTSNAQIAASVEGLYGKEKTMLTLIVDSKINDLVHFGGFIKTGSLTEFQYPSINYEPGMDDNPSDQSLYTFPYAPSTYSFIGSTTFLGGTTRTKGWSIGGYLSLNRSLSRNNRNWFFIRFELEHLRLSDNYDFLWLNRSYGSVFLEETVRDIGVYNYHAVGFATRAGYKRILDKKERLFAQVNLGLSYYHPYYPEPMKGLGYGTITPFMGVEFEVGAGVGYVITKNKRRPRR